MNDIVKVAPTMRGGGGIAIIPQSIDEIWRVARMAVVGNMAPKSLVENKGPDEAASACAIAIMAGAELGLTPMMSLRSYAVVNGRPSLWGDGIKAVVRQSGKCAYIKSGATVEELGWCEAKRTDTGEVKRLEFTWEQAKKARLDVKAGPWKEYPDMMMERRATFRCLNDLFADVLGGFVSSDEALDSVSQFAGNAEDQPARSGPPVAPTPPAAPTIDADAPDPTDALDLFLSELEAALCDAVSPEQVEEIFDEMDVQSTLTGDEDRLDRAFKIKSEHVKRAGNTPETLFEGTPEPEGE